MADRATRLFSLCITSRYLAVSSLYCLFAASSSVARTLSSKACCNTPILYVDISLNIREFNKVWKWLKIKVNIVKFQSNKDALFKLHAQDYMPRHSKFFYYNKRTKYSVGNWGGWMLKTKRNKTLSISHFVSLKVAQSLGNCCLHGNNIIFVSLVFFPECSFHLLHGRVSPAERLLVHSQNCNLSCHFSKSLFLLVLVFFQGIE